MFAETPHGFTETYRSLAEYEASWMWRNSKIRYRLSGALLECFICGSPDFELHHRSYMYIGSEQPNELVTLCTDHHWAVECLIRARKASRWEAHLALRAQIANPRRGDLRRLSCLDHAPAMAAA